MKITVEYSENITSNELSVKTAEYIGDYVIRIYFNTNEGKIVDFKPFLQQSIHPSVRKYLNEKIFSSYKIHNGNLNWNDYDLIFPVNDLYENTIMRKV